MFFSSRLWIMWTLDGFLISLMTFGDPFSSFWDVVNRREEDHWKSFQLCWKLLLELFSRSSPFPSPSEKSRQASSHCFCRKRCGKDQAARCHDLLKMPWAGTVSLHIHLLKICLEYSFLCCFSFKQLDCSLCLPSPCLKNALASTSCVLHNIWIFTFNVDNCYWSPSLGGVLPGQYEVLNQMLRKYLQGHKLKVRYWFCWC